MDFGSFGEYSKLHISDYKAKQIDLTEKRLKIQEKKKLNEEQITLQRVFNVNISSTKPQLNVLNIVILSVKIKNPNHFYEFFAVPLVVQT